MPSIEELLNEAESHMAAQPVNDVLEIDPETREISIPDSEIILGVETDQKAERKYFHCPKIVGNNIDLSALELYVVFQNASNKEEGKDRYHVTDVSATSDGYITFSWELSAKVTEYKGDVQFVVCAIKTDSSGVKQNVWNTTIAIGKCLIGLSSDMSASEEQSASDLYTQLVSELNSTASAKMTEVTTQIQTVGQNQVANVNNAGTTQVNNVQDKGTEVLASIPDTYTELDASVKQLSDQMRGKAPVIVESITSQYGKPVSVSDSAKMPLQGLRLYGKSKQVVTTGKNLCSIKSCQLSMDIVSSDVIAWTKSSRVYYAFDTQNISGAKAYISIKYHDADKKIVGSNGSNLICDGTRKTGWFSGLGAQTGGSDIDLTTIEYISVQLGLYTASVVIPSFIDNIMVCDEANLPFEPYTGGKPSPSPEYPQEIVSVGENGSIEVNVRGKNLVDIYGYSANDIDSPEDKRVLNNAYGTTLNTTEKADKLIVNQEILDGAIIGNYTSGYFCIGINRKLEVNKYYIIMFRFNVTRNPLSISEILVSFNGISFNRAKVIGDKVTVKAEYKELGKKQYVEVRNNGMSAELSDFMITEVGETDDLEPYKQSTATIPLPNGLPGIPVTTGGNYTDENGQQYICDEIDFAAGKYVQRVWKGVFDGSSDEEWTYDNAQRARIILNNGNLGTYDQRDIASMCSNLLWNRNVYSDSNRENGYLINNNIFFVRVAESLALNTEPDFRTWLASNPITLQYVLATPIETDLSEAQIQAYKSLTTFKPTSIISNDAGAQMEVEYAADTKAWVTNKINTLIKEAITS